MTHNCLVNNWIMTQKKKALDVGLLFVPSLVSKVSLASGRLDPTTVVEYFAFKSSNILWWESGDVKEGKKLILPCKNLKIFKKKEI